MIRKWYKSAKEDKNKCQQSLEIWNKIVKIIQTTFCEGNIPISFSYGVLVLIPKPDQSLRGDKKKDTIYNPFTAA
jgi:hypothetical protein